MKKLILFLALLCITALFTTALCTSAFAQQVYVSVDKNGVPLYSDQPVAGSKKLELKVSLQNQQPQQETQINPLASLTDEPTPYQLTILTPAMQDTVISHQGEVVVQSDVSPQLAEHHKLRLVLDNNQQSPLQQSSNFRLLGVERGEHQLQLQALDQNGKLIAESTVTTFYLRKNTIASPK
ncbi:DUF4124 domain-containing protein [Rheinheimera sp. MM224]|uniref:DUF4124 domain-containing protein n=1 Tax=Rheinheimera sp. MM224 TaxID=3019969 RepID=UPI0021F9181F|nr:DUF4124 domain-containing protein [Rheinheimera sp. MM224]CAI3792728.1 hypothetical protein JAMGFMIE_00631 [Rheinheimera sp. MM224]